MVHGALGVQGNPPPAGGAWSSGLCHCFDDAGGCNGSLYLLLSAATGLGCLCCYRSRLRSQYRLTDMEKPCADCCVHMSLCCEPCALCQEYRELKARGFHMSLGWAGKALPTAIAPPQAQMCPGMMSASIYLLLLRY
ncbi:hypothetical protein BS78_06G122800 [Paspalum vaginatum]|nr:hypothetical protein BS78_06G122800 [Paspalum vaginatum]